MPGILARWTFRREVGAALATLGIAPRRLAPVFRRGIEARGLAMAASPEEVALMIAAALPVAGGVSVRRGAVEDWMLMKRVRPAAPGVAEALERLRLSAGRR